MAGVGEVIAWGALLVALGVSRWAVAPSILHDWDSANYALATLSFDVFEHQPHPPGYPLFVLLLRVAGWLGGDVTVRFLVVNFLLGGAAVVLIGRVVRPTAGPVAAWLLGLAFAVSPQFWYHGSASTAYVAESFCSVLVAWSAWALASRRLGWAAAGAAFAVAIGLRPNAAVTLLPLATVAALFARPKLLETGRLVAAFGMVCACWAVPLLVWGGGWSRYREATSAISTWQMNYGSALNGDVSHVVKNGTGLVTYLLDATNVGLVFLVVNGALLVWYRRIPWRDVALLAAWFIPGALFYAIHHLPKSGYVLTLSPAMFVASALATGWAASFVSERRRASWRAAMGALIAAYVTLNTGAFVVSVPRELLIYRDAPVSLPSLLLMTGDYGTRGLRYSTWPHARTRELVDGLDRDRDAALFLFGAHELHRVQMWYHPDQWLLATSTDHGVWFSSRSDDLTFGELQIRLLQPPPHGYPTWSDLTTIRRRGDVVELERAGNTLELPLDPFPERLLVFYPCDPCGVRVADGWREQERVEVGIAYGASLLVPVGASSASPLQGQASEPLDPS